MLSALPCETLLGDSLAAKKLREQVEDASSRDCPVLLEGERGTGRELVARVLHARSARRAAGFVRIDNEFFERQRVEEKLRRAAGGTLLIKEVAQMGPDPQRHLLRILRSSDEDAQPSVASAPAARIPNVRVLASSGVDLGLEALHAAVTATGVAQIVQHPAILAALDPKGAAMESVTPLFSHPDRTEPANRSGLTWQPSDYESLVDGIREGLDLPALASRLGRSSNGVSTRLRRLLPLAQRDCLFDQVLPALRLALADPGYDWRAEMLLSPPPAPIIHQEVIRTGLDGLSDDQVVTVAYALLASGGREEAELLDQLHERLESDGLMERLIGMRAQRASAVSCLRQVVFAGSMCVSFSCAKCFTAARWLRSRAARRAAAGLRVDEGRPPRLRARLRPQPDRALGGPAEAGQPRGRRTDRAPRARPLTAAPSTASAP